MWVFNEFNFSSNDLQSYGTRERQLVSSSSHLRPDINSFHPSTMLNPGACPPALHPRRSCLRWPRPSRVRAWALSCLREPPCHPRLFVSYMLTDFIVRGCLDKGRAYLGVLSDAVCNVVVEGRVFLHCVVAAAASVTRHVA